jgi:hypothetical protein
VSPLTPAELQHFQPTFDLSIGSNGLLQYGVDQSGIIVSFNSNPIICAITNSLVCIGYARCTSTVIPTATDDAGDHAEFRNSSRAIVQENDGEEDEDDGDDDDENMCLCALNEFINERMMLSIDNLPKHWSIALQKQTLLSLHQNRDVLININSQCQREGKRLLCNNHVRILARGIGLRLSSYTYEEALKILAKIAPTSSHTEFEKSFLHHRQRWQLFRNGKNPDPPRTNNPPVTTSLYRYNVLTTVETQMERLLEKVRANGDKILTDMVELDVALLNRTGYVDFPNIYGWVFETGNRIKEMALKEVEIHNYHLSSGAPKGNLNVISVASTRSSSKPLRRIPYSIFSPS